jgi:hypothetical protein
MDPDTMRYSPHWNFVAFLTSTSFLLLLAIGVGLNKGSDWWAAWGQWIGGFGSIAAAVTAVWIAHEGWRKSDKQLSDQSKYLEEREARNLASKFGVWIQAREAMEYDERGTEIGPYDEYRLVYRNAGVLPVYNVQVRPIIIDQEYTWDFKTCLPTMSQKILKERSRRCTMRCEHKFAGYSKKINPLAA